MSYKKKTKNGEAGGTSGSQVPVYGRDDWPSSDPDSSSSPSVMDDINIRPHLTGDGEEFPTHFLSQTSKQLYCATGFNLAVTDDGRVYGERESFHDLAKLEMTSSTNGEVRIKGVVAGLYVAMDENGRVYAKTDGSGDDVVFHEGMANGYNSYLNKKYQDRSWYLAIKKSGKPKKGPKTAWNQKAVKFLTRAAASN